MNLPNWTNFENNDKNTEVNIFIYVHITYVWSQGLILKIQSLLEKNLIMYERNDTDSYACM
jgi:hypothetical protein